MPRAVFKVIVHEGEQRIQVSFESNPLWNERLKKVPGAKWSKTLRSWHVPDTEENRKKCGLPLGQPALPNDTPVLKLPANKVNQNTATTKPKVHLMSEDNRRQFEKYLQHLQLKSYSPKTIRTYCNEFGNFLCALKNVSAESLTTQRVKDYLHYCHVSLGLSENTIHSRINALKFYYEQVLGREKFFWEIPRPQRPETLPDVLNKEEIASIINNISNLKHKTMLLLAYGCGLRVSEITKLKITDIDGARKLLTVKRGKGKKDRVISISPAVLVMLREYYKKYLPKEFLFEGLNKEKSYSIRSLEAIIVNAKRKAGIKKAGSMHMLRHSFATHLLDKGTDVVLIQKLLGHSDIRTTLRYLHVTNRDLLNVLSPLEDIKDLLK